MKKALWKKIRKEKTLMMMNLEREEEALKDFRHLHLLMFNY
jgi:hypothetical protein